MTTLFSVKHLRILRITAVAGFVAAAGFSIPAAQAEAGRLSARDQAAFDVRFLQTEFMVAALSCGRPDFHSHYNTFVKKFGGSLKRHGSALKSYFARQYGGQGGSRLDSYTTKLANEASLRSMRQASFCQDTGRLMERAVALEASSLEGFSAAFARQSETLASGLELPAGGTR